MRGARSGDDLLALVQEAIRLEFSTIPPHLTAMLSLKPGQNREIWWTIRDVVVDEMLHMTIACNLLNALGGRPVIAEPGFVTIGEFYRALVAKLTELGDRALSGDPTRQVVAPRWFPAERLFAITDHETATRALRLIVEEGEGTPLAPVDPDGDVAHYYRFEGIWRGRRLVRDATTPAGFSFSGPPYPFDAGGVWNLTPHQKLAGLNRGTEAWRRAHQFQTTFTRLLTALQRVFDGEPEHLDAAMGVMFELNLAGQVLASLPVGGSAPTNAGPVLEYAIVNE